VGAELTQETEEETRQIGFFSHRLKPCQRNYSATELETYAIQMALRHFAPIVSGTETIIRTDHRPITHLDTMVNDNNKLMRWAQVIQHFPHQFQYKPGKENIRADALSRGWHDETLGGDSLKEGEMSCQRTSQPSDRPSELDLEGTDSLVQSSESSRNLHGDQRLCA